MLRGSCAPSQHTVQAVTLQPSSSCPQPSPRPPRDGLGTPRLSTQSPCPPTTPATSPTSLLFLFRAQSRFFPSLAGQGIWGGGGVKGHGVFDLPPAAGPGVRSPAGTVVSDLPMGCDDISWGPGRFL